MPDVTCTSPNGGEHRAGLRRHPVRCGGRIVPPFSGPLQQTLTEGTGVACVFTNRFQPTGDDTDGILIGTYDIQESAPAGTSTTGWRLESVTCDGIPVGSAQGRDSHPPDRRGPDLRLHVHQRQDEHAAGNRRRRER